MVLGWSLAAGSSVLACGETWSAPPGPAAEANETAGSASAGRAGAPSNSAGGAQVQPGTAGSGGEIVLEIGPLGGGSAMGDSGAAQATEPHAAFPCDDPQPYALGGGYLVCKDKSLRIGERSECASVLPRDTPTLPLFFEDCALDVDCTASANGLCVYGQCKYGCVSDDDCDGGLCFCGAEIGVCVSAECRSDADCPPDYPCTGNQPFGYDAASFRCQTPVDTCASDYDCPGARVHCQVGYVGEVERRMCVRDTVG